ncbi:MAG: hydroxymethylbilane synthase [Betaproteobacteria bacterium]|nr:hydroxymethylbilane synthase [Betaproteobacteria bacterium]MBV9360536.1 hydroxymethylbilane synthase [Betaproteobacteria bacterium]
MKKLVIATRRSRLALWQAEHIQKELQRLHPGLRVELLPMSTKGDEILDRSLDSVGGKGLFVKELENAMADGRADLAVHSIKDVPADLPQGFVLAAISAREDPRDALVSNRFATLAEMPRGAVLGTSSLRRAAQVRERHPGLGVKLLRGNVETRVAKLDRGEYDAIVLAVAGLVRLGLAARIRSRLSLEESLPAPGQGALGIECLAARKDVQQMLAPLADATTAQCVRAERAVSRALGGSCTIPLGAYAEMRDGKLDLTALVASEDGRRVLRARAAGSDPEEVGAQAARSLRDQGADAVLGALK